LNKIEVIAMPSWEIRPMLKKDAWEISRWKYEEPYSFYNRTDEPPYPTNPDAQITDGFSVWGHDGQLIGYFHFGEDGHIPTEENYVYDSAYLDIGLGMRPDLCSRGTGEAFVRFGLSFAKAHYGARQFRLSVAAFNERAIKVYERAGFVKQCAVTNARFKNQFYIMRTPTLI